MTTPYPKPRWDLENDVLRLEQMIILYEQEIAELKIEKEELKILLEKFHTKKIKSKGGLSLLGKTEKQKNRIRPAPPVKAATPLAPAWRADAVLGSGGLKIKQKCAASFFF